MVREIAHEASTGSLGTSPDPIRSKDGLGLPLNWNKNRAEIAQKTGFFADIPS